MRLIEKQRIFAVERANLVLYATQQAGTKLWHSDNPMSRRYVNIPTIGVREGEGYVGDTDSDRRLCVHRCDGGHYKRIACDLMVDVNGRWIKSSSHPIWEILGQWWLRRQVRYTKHVGFAWGGSWGDANHFSIEDGGVK